MENAMTEKVFYKSFFIMTLTIALQNLITYGVNLADSVMMGAYSETALSGVGVCNNIQFFLMMAVLGVANGTTVIASRCWGMKDIKSVKSISAVAFILGAGASFIIFAFCAVAPSAMVHLFTDKEAVAQQAVDYLIIVKWTYILYGITQILLAVLKSVETVNIGFYVSLSSFGINILLNYMFIYGRFGAPEMGVRGAAVATLISRAVELVVVAVYTFAIDKKLRLKFTELFITEKAMFRNYFRTGSPLLASNVSWGIAMSIQGAIIGRLVESAIAANSIATTMFQISTVVTYASSAVASVLIAKTIGEGSSLDVIKKRSRNLQLIFIGIGIFSSCMLIMCKSLMIGFYDAAEETVKYTNQFTLVLAVSVIGTSYEAPVLCGIVSGGGETSFVLKNDIIWMWCIVLPASALSAFVFRFPVAVTFACLKADQVLKCIVAFFKVRKYNWIKRIETSEQQ